MPTFKSFETEHLLLNPTSVEDAGYVLELLNSPKWLHYIGDRNVMSLDDAKKYVEERILPQLYELGYSNYTITLKSNGAKIGSCGLYKREGLEHVDIGFAFLPQYEKQGYAFESASKILEVANSELHLKKVLAITTQENTDSQKLLEKLGLKFQKIIRIPNDEEDLMLYEINF